MIYQSPFLIYIAQELKRKKKPTRKKGNVSNIVFIKNHVELIMQSKLSFDVDSFQSYSITSQAKSICINFNALY